MKKRDEEGPVSLNELKAMIKAGVPAEEWRALCDSEAWMSEVLNQMRELKDASPDTFSGFREDCPPQMFLEMLYKLTKNIRKQKSYDKKPVVIFAKTSLEDYQNSGIGDVLAEACPTKFHLANILAEDGEPENRENEEATEARKP